MSLSKQIYAYSVDTSAFYTPDEMEVANRLNRLYVARARDLPTKAMRQAAKQDGKLFTWRKRHYNRIIKAHKEQLSQILDNKRDIPLIRDLQPRAINDRNVISLFESATTRALGIQTGDLTTDLFVVSVYFYQVFRNLVLNGFTYNGERYVFFTASAGQIRTKRALFIREAAYNRIRNQLMCGLSWETINDHGGINPNKFLAYLSLNNSATDTWADFDIDKAIVVDDFETAVHGLVDYIDSTEFGITRKEADTVIPHSDGWGMMDGHKSRMIRAPWIKGLLTDFPFNEWIAEHCPNGKCVVTDIYGKEYTLPDDGIEYILTKSQFKLAKYYTSWDDYKRKFKQYGCEVCYCNLEDDEVPTARINYQMLQTLTDMTDDEIKRVTQPTVDEIERVGADYRTNMRMYGAVETNRNPMYSQQALMIYPELFRDRHFQDIFKQTKKSYVKQAKAGRLKVNGKYYFVSPDPVAFCQWLFLGDMHPMGVLADGEVYTREFSNGSELACLRSPHLYREWAVRTNKRNAELDRWLGQTSCIYTSTYDLISRFLMFDCDGDKLLVIKDRTLTAVAKRNMADIVPLAYDLRKANGGKLDYESIYDGMIASYSGGNIGVVSNNISKVWGNSTEVTDNELNAVKYLCLYNNAVIDYAKTLWLPTFPPHVDQLVKSYTKHGLPYYFTYAKDKTDEQVEAANGSTMNRISAAIPPSRLKLNKTLGKFDYTMLMDSGCGYDRGEDSNIIQLYIYWLKRLYLFRMDDDRVKQDDQYVCKQLRKNIFEDCEQPPKHIVNTLVHYLYADKPTWTRKYLWGAFGKELVDNLRENTAHLGKICPICGRRFKPRANAQVYCSDDCAHTAKIEMTIAAQKA